MSLEAIELNNSEGKSNLNNISAYDNFYSANSFVNFNRGLADGMRIFIVSIFNNFNDFNEILDQSVLKSSC